MFPRIKCFFYGHQFQAAGRVTLYTESKNNFIGYAFWCKQCHRYVERRV